MADVVTLFNQRESTEAQEDTTKFLRWALQQSEAGRLTGCLVMLQYNEQGAARRSSHHAHGLFDIAKFCFLFDMWKLGELARCCEQSAAIPYPTEPK